MRYAIGMTKINKNTKQTSPPYLVCIDKTNDYNFSFEINIFRQMKNQKLVIVNTEKEGKKLMDFLRLHGYKQGGISFYLLKIDSLNFPYFISNERKRKSCGGVVVYYEEVLKLKS